MKKKKNEEKECETEVPNKLFLKTGGVQLTHT